MAAQRRGKVNKCQSCAGQRRRVYEALRKLQLKRAAELTVEGAGKLIEHAKKGTIRDGE